MTVIPIEMLREHRYRDDGSRLGDMRVLPRKWSGELDEEAAIIAIATGAARARVPLTNDQAHAVEVYKAAKAGDRSKLVALGMIPADEASTSSAEGQSAAMAAAAAAAASVRA